MNLKKNFSLLTIIIALNAVPAEAGWWEDYKPAFIATGCIVTTALATNWAMGRSVDNRISHELEEKETQLNNNITRLAISNGVVNSNNSNSAPLWEINLNENYRDLNYARENNTLPTLDKITIPDNVDQPRIIIGNPGILGNVANYFGNEVVIDSQHKYAPTLSSLLKNIDDYNKKWEGQKKATYRYGAFWKLHTTFKDIYNRHAKSIAGFVKTSQQRQAISNYSDYTQLPPITSTPVLDANVETELVTECGANGTHPYYNAGIQLDDEIKNITNALDNKNNLMDIDSVIKKVTEGNDHLKKMNILLKRTLNYTEDLDIYNKELRQQREHENQQEKLRLEKERIKNEQEAKQRELDLKAREVRAKEELAKADAEKKREEAKLTQSVNTNYRKETNQCPVQ